VYVLSVKGRSLPHAPKFTFMYNIHTWWTVVSEISYAGSL